MFSSNLKEIILRNKSALNGSEYPDGGSRVSIPATTVHSAYFQNSAAMNHANNQERGGQKSFLRYILN